MDDAFTFTSSSFPDTTRVAAFRGREEISRPYAFEVFLIVPGDDAKSFDVPDALGTLATLKSHPDRKHPLAFHGVLLAVELVQAHDRFALFRATLAPRFQRLAHTHHSRLFTEMAVPDIIKDVLEANGLTSSDYALQLSGSYATEEHVCQYRESDLDFVSRWMEHVGLYYYFEQGDDAEKLIITDSKASQTDLPTDPIRYTPSTQDRSAGAAIETFRFRATSLPASVRVRDYDYTKPTLDISGEAKVQKTGLGEISVYSARAFSPGEATKIANLRAEELLAGQLEHFGGGTMPLRAGYEFTLEEHPLDLLNQKYLATAAEHFANLASTSPELEGLMELPFKDVYRCEVTAIPAKVQFRAARRTPWPRVYGFEHGLIDGGHDSDYAQIDDNGRYRVKFFFDESPLKDGKASTWVRMMQPHGGGVEGFHFPLRKGTEVVLSFMGGDPDRPVIAGVVNTTTTPSPVTSGNSTRNVIQTGGRNRIEIEDKAGQERITLSSPHANSYIRMGAPNDEGEMHVNSDGTGIICLGKNYQISVGGYKEEDIAGTVKETYHSTHKQTVSGAQTLEVGPRSLKVHGAHSVTNDGHHTETDSSGVTRSIAGSGLVETIAPGVTRMVAAGVNETIGGAVTQLIGGATTQVIGGAFTQNVAGAVSINWPGTSFWSVGPTHHKFDSHAMVTVGATTDTFIGVKHSAMVGLNVSTNYAANLTYSMSLDVTVAAALKATIGPTINLTESADIELKAVEYSAMCAEYKIVSGSFFVKSGKCDINGMLVKLG